MNARRALVTGATGFVAGRLLPRLAADGWQVLSLAPEGEVDLLVDLRDTVAVKGAVAAAEPAVVFHLAAIARGGTDRDGIEEMLAVNVDGTRALTQAMGRLTSPPRLVSAGSLAEFGAAEGPYDGEPSCGAVSPYGSSKRIAAELARLYAMEFDSAAVVLRSCDLYGPARDGAYFLPALLRTLLEGQRFAMTAGEHVRDHLFVDDFVDALVRAADAPCVGYRTTCLGSGAATPLAELARRAAALLGQSDKLDIGALPYRAGEPQLMYANVRQAAEWLGWKPQHSLDEGLRITIASLRSSHEETCA